MQDYHAIASTPPPRDGTVIFVVNADSIYPGNIPCTVKWGKGHWVVVHSTAQGPPYDEYKWGNPTHWAPVNWS